MRDSVLLPLLVLLAACQATPAPVPSPTRAQPAAAQSTSDMPPRGIEPPDALAVTPPPDAGLPRARSDAAPAEAGEDDRPCSTDGDCALTRVAKGECCEMLCDGRAVTKARAAELAGKVATCPASLGHACPVPLCRPPRFVLTPACEQGRCVARRGPSDR
jgi:hypothetical protein